MHRSLWCTGTDILSESLASVLVKFVKFIRVLPRAFEQVSPFLTPVGMDVDTNKFVVKGDKA